MNDKNKNMCNGCYDDPYNHGLGWQKECWYYATAVVEKKIQIHISEPPPYKKESDEYLSCYKKERYVFIKPENLTHEGYWK